MLLRCGRSNVMTVQKGEKCELVTKMYILVEDSSESQANQSRSHSRFRLIHDFRYFESSSSDHLPAPVPVRVSLRLGLLRFKTINLHLRRSAKLCSLLPHLTLPQATSTIIADHSAHLLRSIIHTCVTCINKRWKG